MRILGQVQALFRGAREYVHQQLCYSQLRLLHSPSRIREFQNRHRGEVIFCIGSGPSLRSEDVDLLNGQIAIFVNGSFRLLEAIDPSFTYWIVQDYKNLDRYREVDRARFSASFRSVHQWTHSCLRSPFRRGDVILLPRVTRIGTGWPLIEEPGKNLSWDISETIGMTPTVLFTAIQVAAYMGASTIALLGFDLDYGTGSAHFYDEQKVSEERARRFVSVVEPVLAYYNQVFNNEVARLVNCSCITRDTVLPKYSLAEMVSSSTVSSIRSI